MKPHKTIKKKTTFEIRSLIEKANMKFDSIVNEALNHYLQKIFISCPFTGEICTKSQCMECETSKPAEQTQQPAIITA